MAVSYTHLLWENDPTDGLGQWSIDEGGTSSTGTGPGTGAGTGQPDYFPGTATGNYVYMESGSCSGNTLIALSPVYDISSFTNPNVRVQMAYNMFGATTVSYTHLGDLSISFPPLSKIHRHESFLRSLHQDPIRTLHRAIQVPRDHVADRSDRFSGSDRSDRPDRYLERHTLLQLSLIHI